MFEKIYHFWTWYSTSGMDGAILPIPVLETFLVFAALTFCLFFRLPRIGLLMAYVFIYRWGWAVRDVILLNDPGAGKFFTVAYIVFGILVFTFVIIGMVTSKD